MKTQSKFLLQTLSKSDLDKLTLLVEETPVKPSRDKKFTIAEFDRIVKHRRVFQTRRFFEHG